MEAGIGANRSSVCTGTHPAEAASGGFRRRRGLEGAKGAGAAGGGGTNRTRRAARGGGGGPWGLNR